MKGGRKVSYIEKNLLADERIMFRTRKHFILFFPTVLLVLVTLCAAYFMYYNTLLNKLFWVPLLIAFIYSSCTWLEYMTSEFAVTDKRVMMREGFFHRHANETRLKAISQVNIDQNLIGQLLDYGTVSINAFGAFDAYTLIAHPYQFQKAVNEQLDKAG